MHRRNLRVRRRGDRRARGALVALFVVTGGCTALEDYSVRMAERSCQDVPVCTVEGPQGTSLSPCMYGRDGAIYPGDSGWPYTTPGVCDVVVDGKVTSSRELPK